jgi:antagonist of KipI
MSLSIIKAGILDTFQDQGRSGFQHLGINPNGVMDRYAAQLSNLLAGNNADDVVLEMSFPAAILLFEEECIIVIGGADFAPEVNGEPLPLLQPVRLPAFSVLHFKQWRNGSWCYLAVHGGFNIDPWLNSCSTHLKAGAGGWQGRKLKEGDRIPVHIAVGLTKGIEETVVRIFPWKAVQPRDPAGDCEIWITEGPETERLDEPGLQLIEDELFTVLPASDRMAYSFKGPVLTSVMKEQMVSSAVSFGTLQLLPDGQLIVLMADHQTTGGYPRIGQVIQAHLSKLAQCRPGDQIGFKIMTLPEAQQLWLQHHDQLRRLEYACRFKKESFNK